MGRGGGFAIEQRSAHGAVERYPELTAELIRLKVDVLVTDGSPATKAAQKATTTIPIVFVSGNPIAQGFVESLSRPGGNLTGVAIITGDHNPARIELLKPAVPGLARLATLEDQSGLRSAPSDAHLPGNWQAIEAAARQPGIHLTPARGVRQPDDLPVEQPTKLEPGVNLKTAKALGLTIPQSVLGRADEVIQ